MDSNKIIQSLWVGSQLSNIEQLCIKSFLSNGHDFHLYTYEEVKGVPKGTTIQDANEILPESNIFKYGDGWGKGSVAGFADLFRYNLLFQKGGWWVDTDVICLKSLDIENDLVISSSYELQWGEPANNCILKIPKQHDLAKRLVEESDNRDNDKLKFGETGPHLVQKLVKEMDLENSVVPYYYFNPIRWAYVNDYIAYKNKSIKIWAKENIRPLLKPSSMKGRKIEPDSYTVHLWNEVWRQSGLNKNDSFDKNCLFEKLKRKYDVL